MNTTSINFRLVLVVIIYALLTALEIGYLPLIGIGIISHALWINNFMRNFQLEKRKLLSYRNAYLEYFMLVV